MRLGDLVSRLTIDRRKLIAYALDPDSPKGQHKAILFQRRLGYNLDNYESLLKQIEELVMEGEAIEAKVDDYGQRYYVDLVVVGMEGQSAIVRTAWIVEARAKDCGRLISLYVRK
jgi:filamentous hemagglutinin